MVQWITCTYPSGKGWMRMWTSCNTSWRWSTRTGLVAQWWWWWWYWRTFTLWSKQRNASGGVHMQHQNQWQHWLRPLLSWVINSSDESIRQCTQRDAPLTLMSTITTDGCTAFSNQISFDFILPKKTITFSMNKLEEYKNIQAATVTTTTRIFLPIPVGALTGAHPKLVRHLVLINSLLIVRWRQSAHCIVIYLFKKQWIVLVS